MEARHCSRRIRLDPDCERQTTSSSSSSGRAQLPPLAVLRAAVGPDCHIDVRTIKTTNTDQEVLCVDAVEIIRPEAPPPKRPAREEPKPNQQDLMVDEDEYLYDDDDAEEEEDMCLY